MESQYGHGWFLAGGSENFVLDEWVVEIDLLASIHWPTPYNWRVGYNRAQASRHTPTEIGKALNFTIQRQSERKDSESKSRSGQPDVISDRDRRYIIKHARANPRLTYAQLQLGGTVRAPLGLNVAGEFSNCWYTNTPTDEQCNIGNKCENAKVFRSDVNFPSATR